jgi:threonine dehydratase
MFAHETGIGIATVRQQQSTHGGYVRSAMTTSPAPDDATIRQARAAGAGVVKHTPVTSSAAISERCGGIVELKAENLQRTGSFKIRGAMAKLASLGDAAARGVTAGSAGNHAQALAFAARHHGVRCQIFVPAGAPISKTEACRAYGAEVIEGGASLSEAVASARARAAETGMTFCHPYDDPTIVAGQASLGLELLEDLADLRRVIVPLGGGGLASGIAIAVKRARPEVKVIGVQTEVCAPYANQPAPEGAVLTLADGIAVKLPGDVTRPLVEEWLDDVVTVDEESIADAMVLLMERSKLFVEGAGAVGVAALLAERVAPARSGVTCVVLSGGNVDLGVLPGLIRRHETQAGRRLILFARISDRPGGLADLVTILAGAGANIIEVEHVREGIDLHVRETGVQVVLEVRNRHHAEAVIDAAMAGGHVVTELGASRWSDTVG